MNKFILNAYGISTGGGLSIYNIFRNISFKKFFIDSRLKNKNITRNYIIIYIKRLINEILIKLKYDKDYSFVYLSGLPPLFRFKNLVYCVFQNANIFYYPEKNFLSWLFSLDFIRYLYFKLFSSNADTWLVLSSQSKNILIKNGIKEYLIKTVNILPKYKKFFKKNKRKKIYDLIYPASYLKHKNHKNLIKGLIILSKRNIYPKVLFVNNINEKFKYSNLINQFKLKIFFKSYSLSKIKYAYSASKALIFPSFNETFGLPLIESNFFGLSIISADLPYAYEFVQPNYTFDPNNSASIAKAINKFLLSKKKKNYLKNVNFDFNNIKDLNKIFS
jgi:hypothetical protein